MKMRGLLTGFIMGIVVTGLVMWLIMPGVILKEYRSPFDIDTTVETIKQNALAEGWVVSGVQMLDGSVRKHGGGELRPVRLVNLCEPHHSYSILEKDENKVVSVMMPCTISAYEKSDGSTWVGVMNAGLLGRMFGGTVAEVMGGDVARQQAKFISFVER